MKKSRVLGFFALCVTSMTVISTQSEPAQACLVDPCPSGIDSMGGVSIISHIKSGRSFTVAFDQVGSKFNDSGWTGNTDPMGTLKAGETYQVTYSSSKYTTRGFNEGTNSVISATYSNAKPDEGKISLWGRVYTFDGNRNVYDPQFGLVGTLRF